MKKSIILSSCLLLAAVLQAQGIKFQKNLSWEQVLIKAKNEKKYIFVDVYATWCGPCKAMDAETFSRTSVGKFINADFVAVKVQMDRTRDDDEYVMSWYRYAEDISVSACITAYPTFLFYSPEGKLIHKSIGYKDATGLVAEARNALDSSKQYFTLLEKYKEGRLDNTQIKTLALQAKVIGDDSSANIVSEYFIKNLVRENVFEKDNLEFISLFISQSSNPNFLLFSNNIKKVNDATRKNVAEDFIMNIVQKEEVAPYQKKENTNWDIIEKRAAAKFGKLGEERVAGEATLYYAERNDWVKFGKYYKKYFDLSIPHERHYLHINNLSWLVFENVIDHAVLETALNAMKYTVEKVEINDAQVIDTYANLLFKVGNYDEAISWEEKAVKISNNSKIFVDTLTEMKEKHNR